MTNTSNENVQGNDTSNQNVPPSDKQFIDTRIDKFTFFGVLIILSAVTLPLIFFPEKGQTAVNLIKDFVTQKFGVLYLAMGVATVIFVAYICFSDIGNIKAGKPEDKMEYGPFSWAAMLFCAGIGATVLYWGMIEWVYYYEGPPFGLEPRSPDAIRWATTYGMFHWGPFAWTMYLTPAIPIAYFYHVRKTPILKVSQSLAPLFGEKWAASIWGRAVDVFFIFGMIGGGATALGIVVPLITGGLNELFGLPDTNIMKLIILLVTSAIFGYSAFRGMKGGIQVLSNINLVMALFLLAFVFVFGPKEFILNVGLESYGRSISNVVTMMTEIGAFSSFTDYGFKKTTFAQDWTIFYWAWWLVFAPTIGLFIARISRGRTIRQMAVGAIFFGSLGCAMYFIILGNYSLFLQLTGKLDVVGILDNEGAYAAIFATLRTLPFSTFIVGLFTILSVIFTATTYDSISYILAAIVQREVDDEPKRWNRLFWAFTICLLPAVLMFTGDLSTLQTASIFAGTPLIIIMSLMMLSIIKAAKFDLRFQPDYSTTTILLFTVLESGSVGSVGSNQGIGFNSHLCGVFVSVF